MLQKQILKGYSSKELQKWVFKIPKPVKEVVEEKAFKRFWGKSSSRIVPMENKKANYSNLLLILKNFNMAPEHVQNTNQVTKQQMSIFLRETRLN